MVDAAPRRATKPVSKPPLGTPEAAAVNRKSDREELYAARVKVYPRRVYGLFRMIKWVAMGIALVLYYGLPWMRYDRGAGVPDQAVLFDVPARKAYVFGIELWAQEVYFATGLLVLAALTLFLMTSVAGRVWCGYACPQTVWTDLFVHIERWIQGDRSARIRLDKAPWGPKKIFLKGATHASWLIVALLTGGAMILYFHDAPSTVSVFFTGGASLTAYVFAFLLMGMTYLLGGIAREQVCIYMCPWPRIQGALVDDRSLLVSYDKNRGESRGKYRKGESFEGRGDCIDCNQCVAVCPMGIDIRDGFQMECIQCALCIDACNTIMDKIDRPGGLIRYASVAEDSAGGSVGKASRIPTRFERWRQFLKTALRARTYVYLVLITLVGSLMLWALVTRTDFIATTRADRSPLYVMLSSGEIRNGYSLHLINRQHMPRPVTVTAEGIDGVRLATRYSDPMEDVTGEIPGDGDLTIRLFAHLPRDVIKTGALPEGKGWITLVIKDMNGIVLAMERVPFNGPNR